MGLDGQTRQRAATDTALSFHRFSADMIGPSCDPGTGGAGSYVARAFSHSGATAGAVLHLSAQGLYRAFLNGKRVGNDLLTPGWTCYDDRIKHGAYLDPLP